MTRRGETSSAKRWRRACRATLPSASRTSCWHSAPTNRAIATSWQGPSEVKGALLSVIMDGAQRVGRLAGMVAIVTGAGSRGPGIGNGRAGAILFAREGARVALVDRVAEWAEQTRGMISDEHGEAFVIEADVTRDEDCTRVVEQTVQRYGPINILHNNVGIGGSGSVVDADADFWDEVMRVNAHHGDGG